MLKKKKTVLKIGIMYDIIRLLKVEKSKTQKVECELDIRVNKV